jgi:molecular chaperone DnaK
LKDLADKMDADTKSKVEAAANALEEAIKGNNPADIKAKTEALNNAWNEASTKMYESAKSQQAPPTGQPGAGGQQQGPFAGGQPGAGPQQQQQGGDQGGKKVENADFEVVDDK